MRKSAPPSEEELWLARIDRDEWIRILIEEEGDKAPLAALIRALFAEHSGQRAMVRFWLALYEPLVTAVK